MRLRLDLYARPLFVYFLPFLLRRVCSIVTVESAGAPRLSGAYVRGVVPGKEHAFVIEATACDPPPSPGKALLNELWLFAVDRGMHGWRWHIAENDIFGAEGGDALAFIDTWTNNPCHLDQHHHKQQSSSGWMIAHEGDWVADAAMKVSCETIVPFGDGEGSTISPVDHGGIHSCDQPSSTATDGIVPCVRLAAPKPSVSPSVRSPEGSTASSAEHKNAEGRRGVYMPLVMLGTAYISASHGSGAADHRAVERPPAIESALFGSRSSESEGNGGGSNEGGENGVPWPLHYRGLDLGSQLHPAYANELLVGNLLRHGRSSKRRLDRNSSSTSNSSSNSYGSRGWNLRDRVFLTTKLSPNEHGFTSTLTAVQRSLRLLGTDTIDLYLIHHPRCLMRDHSDWCEGDWTESWRAMERLLALGAVRSIGVCNFDAPLLSHLLLHVARAPVALLQSRADPLDWPGKGVAVQQGSSRGPNRGILEMCKDFGVVFQSFSTLGRQWFATASSPYFPGHYQSEQPSFSYSASTLPRSWSNPVLTAPAVAAVTKEVNANYRRRQAKEGDPDGGYHLLEPITAAQVVLRWAIEKGWAVVPKTSNSSRLEANRRIFHFSLTRAQVATIDEAAPPPPPSPPMRQRTGPSARREL